MLTEKKWQHLAAWYRLLFTTFLGVNPLTWMTVDRELSGSGAGKRSFWISQISECSR